MEKCKKENEFKLTGKYRVLYDPLWENDEGEIVGKELLNENDDPVEFGSAPTVCWRTDLLYVQGDDKENVKKDIKDKNFKDVKELVEFKEAE